MEELLKALWNRTGEELSGFILAVELIRTSSPDNLYSTVLLIESSDQKSEGDRKVGV